MLFNEQRAVLGTMQLLVVAKHSKNILSMWHLGVKPKTGWLEIMLRCASGATCL